MILAFILPASLIGLGVYKIIRAKRVGSETYDPLLIPLFLILGILTSYSPIIHTIGKLQAENIISGVAKVESSELKCQNLFEAFLDIQPSVKAYVNEGSNIVYMKYAQCEDLISLLVWKPESPTASQIGAYHILLHESYHVAGIFNESETECKASQRFVQSFQELGYDWNTAVDAYYSYQENYGKFLTKEYIHNCVVNYTK